MVKEHAILTITNQGSCFCDPDILLGSRWGDYNLELKLAPRGTLIDLNGIWELFATKHDLITMGANISFIERN